MSAQPWPAPHVSSASASRLASLSTATGIRSLSLSSSATCTAAQPGRIVDGAGVPVARWIGPGSPTPAPSSRSR